MFQNLSSWFNGILDYVEGEVHGEVSNDARDSGLIDLQCGRTVFNDVPAKMRTELWLSQLHRKSAHGSKAMARYRTLLSTPISEELKADIDKDCHRTFPGHSWLSRPAGQLALRNILRAYAIYDPVVGYTQGMAFLAGLLLTYLDECEAFGALVLVMFDRGLREIYRPDDGLALLQVRLWQLGQLAPPQLTRHMEQYAALPVLYASSWFLTCFAAEFPLHFAARVMDLVITDFYSAPLMKVAVHILERCESQLKEMTDVEEMVNLLKKGVPKWPRSVLHDLLTEALGKGWSSRQERILVDVESAETVADALTRVENSKLNKTTEPKQEASVAGDKTAEEGKQTRKESRGPGVTQVPKLPPPREREVGTPSMSQQASSPFQLHKTPVSGASIERNVAGKVDSNLTPMSETATAVPNLENLFDSSLRLESPVSGVDDPAAVYFGTAHSSHKHAGSGMSDDFGGWCGASEGNSAPPGLGKNGHGPERGTSTISSAHTANSSTLLLRPSGQC